MSKKNKAKFKKQIKNQVLSQMTQVTSDKETAKVATENEPTIKTPNKNNVIEIQNLPQIKADLVKTLIVIASMAILITILVIVDHKNHLLLTFGNWLFRLLHIQ